jgi:hypothetical protein
MRGIVKPSLASIANDETWLPVRAPGRFNQQTG